jgi:hypothetical protein
MNPQYVLVILVIIVMGWFAFGVIYNLRRGDAILKWMQSGLPRIGERTTFRWLGTSVAELVIARAKAPFRRLDVLLVLKPRDVFWMTILARLQGRADVLIFRAHLGTRPFLDFELADPLTWSGRTALAQAAGRGWEGRPYRDLRLMAPAGLLDPAAALLDRLGSAMDGLAPHYVRFRLSKETPNLEIHVPFPNPRTDDAAAYFESLRSLVLALGEH